MTASFRVPNAISFAIASSICLIPPLAHGQSGPETKHASNSPAASLSSRGTKAATRPSSPILERSLSWTGGVLAVGAIALIVSRKFIRPMGIAAATSNDQARITSRVQLTPRQAVHVVRIGSRTLVIGTGPQGSPVTLAQWATEPAASDATEFHAIDDFTEDHIRRIPVEARVGEIAESPVSKNGAAA